MWGVGGKFRHGLLEKSVTQLLFSVCVLLAAGLSFRGSDGNMLCFIRHGVCDHYLHRAVVGSAWMLLVDVVCCWVILSSLKCLVCWE